MFGKLKTIKKFAILSLIACGIGVIVNIVIFIEMNTIDITMLSLTIILFCISLYILLLKKVKK